MGGKITKFIGLLLILGALGIIGLIYFPLINQEIQYQTRKTRSRSELEEEIVPESIGFGLVIPKIGVNARVFPDVDSTNSEEYLPLLAEGVAHARGSAFPGGRGAVFIFAHSADSPFNITRYNAVFYLLNKLEPQDEIEVYYQGKKYVYQTLEKKVTAPEGVAPYVDRLGDGTLVLQTCTPPGTTLNRLLLVAEEVD